MCGGECFSKKLDNIINGPSCQSITAINHLSFSHSCRVVFVHMQARQICVCVAALKNIISWSMVASYSAHNNEQSVSDERTSLQTFEKKLLLFVAVHTHTDLFFLGALWERAENNKNLCASSKIKWITGTATGLTIPGRVKEVDSVVVRLPSGEEQEIKASLVIGRNSVLH